ncbi:transglycosylase SLT domain-containing protein [Lentibacillus sp. N15]|uniref:transglycosylase SLT domain-containing protein n=1 Tax=Lentibacillus songyuanensis TaxID=3136161 RepID=UPI0031BB43FB
MAKLTARFDLEDRISKKLKTISGNAKALEQSRDKLNKPMVLKVKDQATKSLTKVHKFVLKDIAKTHTMYVALKDKATKPLNKLNSFMKRKMPRTHDIIVKAQDKTKSVLEKIRRYAGRHLSKPYMLMVAARDRAMPTLHKIANYAKRALSKGYNFSVRAIDIATKTVSRIASFARTAIPRYRDFTIRAWDRATKIVGTVRRALFSIPTMITVTLGVIGAGKLKDATLGAAMDFEGYQIATEHWLDGNKKKADELVEWMRDFTNKTPFDSPDLFPALARGIGVADGDVGQAKRLLNIATDMAALTPNRTVEDAMDALADANMGEFQTLKGFNVKMTQDDFESWEGFQSDMEDMFSGGAERFSQTSRGLFNKIGGYITASFREAGEGMLESMKPRLDKISTWIDNNQDKWMEWRDTVQKMGEQGAEWVLSKLEGAFFYIRDNYLENDEFKKLDFEGKVKFIMEDLGKWWNDKGRPIMAKVSKDVGAAIFEGIKWGIKEGFKGVGSMWMEAFKDPSVEGFAGAGIATAIAGSILSLVLSPLFKGIRGIFKTGKWFWDQGKKVAGLFGKRKPPKVPPVVPPGGGKTPKGSNKPKGKPTYTQPWFNKGDKVKTPKPNDFKNVSKISKIFKPLSKIAKRIPVIGPALGALSLLGTDKKDMAGAVGGMGGGILGGAAGGAAAGAAFGGVGAIPGAIIGGIAGAFGGEALGDWLSDNWSAIKTKASETGQWISDTFVGIKDSIAETIFSGEWWGEKWDGVKNWTSEKLSDTAEWWNNIKQTASETFFSADWWLEQAGFIYGYLEETIFSGEWWSDKWEIVKEWTEGTIFDGEWWSDKWGSVMEWTSEKWDSAVEIWQSVKTAFAETVFSADWWAGKWESVKGWTQEKWDSAVSVWNSVVDKISETIFSGDWWLEKWEGVKGWTADKWDSAVSIWNSVTDKISETIFSGEWWKGKWESVKDWTSDKWDTAKSIWSDVKTSISETLFSKDWWTGKWDNVVEWGKGVMSGIGGWVSGLIDDVKDSFGKGREKGKNAANPKTASDHITRNTSVRSKKYASGGIIDRPHMGLVGEAGPEAIIPLSANRRSRALDLYNQTGKMLGVRPYANGGIAGGSVTTPKQSTAQASLNVDSISVKGTDQEAEKYGEAFSTSVASGINEKVVPIDNWRKANIDNPMQNVVRDAAGFGSNTVRSFSGAQNETPTHTREHLQNQVKRPFEVIKGGASEWGSGTISRFRSGQNETETGTRPYLVSNVHTPFNDTRAKASGWGSGTMSEFISGMNSKSNGVESAAKTLAKLVDKTFREELGIASPSKVMMKNGMWTSMGIVKGLNSVDIKAFTEKRINDMMSAFSGMGSGSGNVKKWLMAAMMATGAPAEWLAPLTTIAMKESGGRTGPSTINKWDSNWARGTPSMGLMQTIMPTFQANKVSGMNDIMNPIHNAAAAINYIKSRYGTPFNTPGIRSMAAGGPYKGYWKGTDGPLRSAETAWVGERGPELVHLPRGSEVFSNRESKKISSGQLSAVTGSGTISASKGSNKGDVIVQFNGDNHFQSEEDMDKFTDKVKKAIEKVLDDEYDEGGEWVAYE